ncbi:hypothetical protein COS75_02350 [Candidatus Pacearchaeota archaeon CG06_land_8_20_14_3_00_35_12]|nr:MAG: hypothetical protein COS75_02350 [Candidatus Pacearchaeota archaeon CG06_land_8_20_14_3_00_35_12]
MAEKNEEFSDILGINENSPPDEPIHPSEKATNPNKIGQEQFYDLLTGNDMSWQDLIYDLIGSEQLDPWDIDLAILSQKYLEKIKALEEANFFISSKVLLAASIMLKIKSDILLNDYLKGLDDILFGKKEQSPYSPERIEINEDELPLILPRTPMQRQRKVTLQELLAALNTAIKTEDRRIRKELQNKQVSRELAFVMPRVKINIGERIKLIYEKIMVFFKNLGGNKGRMPFTALAGTERGERIATFVPLLHLDHQAKVYLEQEKHFDEIYISMEGKKPEYDSGLEPASIQEELSESEKPEEK